MADEPGYRLSMDTSLREGQLVVAPRIAAPAGAKLRYELVSTKIGAAGKSSTSQSGQIVVDAGGSAALSVLKLGVGAKDRCEVSVRIFDRDKVVAEKVYHFPEQ